MSRAVTLRLTATGAVLVAVVSIARADAPPGQYSNFNRNDVAIVDNWTGLRWERVALYQAASFDDAVAHCAALTLDGLVSWRVPSYKELLTLVDESPHTEYPTGAPVTMAIDGNAFPGAHVDLPYWTSTPYLKSPGDAYVVRFSDGIADHAAMLSANYYVRCVH